MIEAPTPLERSGAQRIGFWLGPALALAIALAPSPNGMTPEAQRVAALAFWMAVWWATEAVPIAATSLLPLIAVPLMGAGSEREAAAPYANPVVLLLLGGFILALAIERWSLHRRIALNVLALAGDRPKAIVGGFIVASAAISMWISNTATALMMIPIALSVAAASSAKDRDRFAAAIVLGVAYACSIGGVATPIGTPTNLIAMTWISEELDQTVSFPAWMAVGLPVMLALLPICWLVVTWGMGRQEADPAAAEEIRRERERLGSLTGPEVRVMAVFAGAAGLWVFGQPIRDALRFGLQDMGVAILAAAAVLIVPAGKAAPGRALLSWSEASKLPWGVVLLFGGGISLAEAMERTGLAAWIGDGMGALAGAPEIVIVLAVAALVIVMTEFMSNVATITMLLPVLGALAVGVGMDPLALVVPAAIAASCGFMMPAGTGPNAVAFGSGRVTVAGMMRRGFGLNIAALLVMTAIGYWLAPRALG